MQALVCEQSIFLLCSHTSDGRCKIFHQRDTMEDVSPKPPTPKHSNKFHAKEPLTAY